MVYYARNIDKTIEWFENTLGWYGTVDARDEKGDAVFVGIVPIPNEITEPENHTYIGFSLFRRDRRIVLLDSLPWMMQRRLMIMLLQADGVNTRIL